MDDELVYEYLHAPLRFLTADDIMGKFPKIIKGTDNEITYRYSNGKKETALVTNISKKEKRPTFPG